MPNFFASINKKFLFNNNLKLKGQFMLTVLHIIDL